MPGRRNLLAGALAAPWMLATGSTARTPAAAGSAAPHPRLAALGDGEAVDLGRYTCEDRAPGLRCETIFDYSRINYDPFGHRMLVFGGGHAATGRTDVDAFDLRTLTWRSLYPSMTCEQVAAGGLDPRGFHRATGHPVARHTYDQSVVVRAGGRGWLMMFSTEGFSGHCHPYRAEIRAVAALPLDTDSPRWAFGPALDMPWGYAGAAAFDPVSGMVVLVGGQRDGLWVYDPAAHRVVAALRRVARPRNSSNLVYVPSRDRMVLVDRQSLQVRSFALDRDDWARTTETVVPAGGTPPPELRNLALDTRNEVLGGVREGVFHALDLRRDRWLAEPMRVRAGAGARPGTVRHHAIDYDPIDNVFVFVDGRPGELRTWAYRFRR